jgi:hypothetical protein
MAVLNTTSPIVVPMAPRLSPSKWVPSDNIKRAFMLNPCEMPKLPKLPKVPKVKEMPKVPKMSKMPKMPKMNVFYLSFLIFRIPTSEFMTPCTLNPIPYTVSFLSSSQ